MVSTFATFVLGTALSTVAVNTPTWQSDYNAAMTAAVAQQKPLAVFIGRGESGYARLVGGTIPTDAGQLLAKDYVCVYVDTETKAGQSLAGEFHLASGLVISSRGGNKQALRHTGTVAPTALTGYLTRYSDPANVVVTTETVGAAPVVVTNVAPTSTVIPAGVIIGGCPNGRCGAVTSYPSAPVYSTFPTFGGCPNGRCPNAR